MKENREKSEPKGVMKHIIARPITSFAVILAAFSLLAVFLFFLMVWFGVADNNNYPQRYSVIADVLSSISNISLSVAGSLVAIVLAVWAIQQARSTHALEEYSLKIAVQAEKREVDNAAAVDEINKFTTEITKYTSALQKEMNDLEKRRDERERRAKAQEIAQETALKYQAVVRDLNALIFCCFHFGNYIQEPENASKHYSDRQGFGNIIGQMADAIENLAKSVEIASEDYRIRQLWDSKISSSSSSPLRDKVGRFLNEAFEVDERSQKLTADDYLADSNFEYVRPSLKVISQSIKISALNLRLSEEEEVRNNWKIVQYNNRLSCVLDNKKIDKNSAPFGNGLKMKAGLEATDWLERSIFDERAKRQELLVQGQVDEFTFVDGDGSKCYRLLNALRCISGFYEEISFNTPDRPSVRKLRNAGNKTTFEVGAKNLEKWIKDTNRLNFDVISVCDFFYFILCLVDGLPQDHDLECCSENLGFSENLERSAFLFELKFYDPCRMLYGEFADIFDTIHSSPLKVFLTLPIKNSEKLLLGNSDEGAASKRLDEVERQFNTHEGDTD